MSITTEHRGYEMTYCADFALIEDSVNQTVTVARRITDRVGYSTRGQVVERFEPGVTFQCNSASAETIVNARDRAMAWVGQKIDRLEEQKREAGSRTP